MVVLVADKAAVFAGELIVVDDDPAAAQIAARLVQGAARLTTGELRHKLRQEIGRFDPQAARHRKERARKDARVDVWIDAEGTGAIAPRRTRAARQRPGRLARSGHHHPG